MTQVLEHTDAAVLQRMRAAEIEEARMVQQAMLPVEPLRTGGAEFAFRFRPVTEVGGDFLDYFELENKNLGFYLGDVVGKGLPAAMFAALTVGALRGMHKTNTRPKNVLEALNRRLRMRVIPGRYCSVLYGVFNPATREFCHANSGLPKPIRILPTGCHELGEGGLPPGLFDGSTYDETVIQTQPGETLVFCTDGVIDARNAKEEDFGEERLHAVCAANRREPTGVLLDRIFEAVDDFAGDENQHDDITLAAIRVG